MAEVREVLIGDGSLKVTTEGRVFSNRRMNGFDKSEPKWHEICTRNTRGRQYKSVWVYHSDGTKEIKKVHRLVADSFLPNPFPELLTEINHIDGNKNNNSVDNLEWTTRGDNVREAVRIGLIKCSLHYCIICGNEYKKKHSGSKTSLMCDSCKREYRENVCNLVDTETQDELRLECRSCGVTVTEISDVAGVSLSMASRWLNGKRNFRIGHFNKVVEFTKLCKGGDE